MRILVGLAMAGDGFVGYHLMRLGRWDLVLASAAVLAIGLGAMAAGKVWR
jgi:sulfite exporter TauE/SafE